MKCNYKSYYVLLLLLAVSTVVLAKGGRVGGGRFGSRSRSSGSSGTSSSGGGGFFSRLFGGGGSKTSSSSSSATHTGSSGSSSYPKQTYNSNSQTYNTNYGWRPQTGGNHYSGTNHYYNAPHSPHATSWGSSSYNNPYSKPSPQNTFGNFHPVGNAAAAPSYHFSRTTSYIPLYIPSHHSYIHHHHYVNSEGQTYKPPTPPSEPVVYKEGITDSYGQTTTSDTPTLVVGFNNMIVYGVYVNDKHFVVTVNEDLDEDVDDIPEKFLNIIDGEIFDVVTLKPTTTTTQSATVEPYPADVFGFDNSTKAFIDEIEEILNINKTFSGEEPSRLE